MKARRSPSWRLAPTAPGSALDLRGHAVEGAVEQADLVRPGAPFDAHGIVARCPPRAPHRPGRASGFTCRSAKRSANQTASPTRASDIPNSARLKRSCSTRARWVRSHRRQPRFARAATGRAPVVGIARGVEIDAGPPVDRRHRLDPGSPSSSRARVSAETRSRIVSSPGSTMATMRKVPSDARARIALSPSSRCRPAGSTAPRTPGSTWAPAAVRSAGQPP
jgi:hypothetical protein